LMFATGQSLFVGSSVEQRDEASAPPSSSPTLQVAPIA
jgi:hypothetical protein